MLLPPFIYRAHSVLALQPQHPVKGYNGRGPAGRDAWLCLYGDSLSTVPQRHPQAPVDAPLASSCRPGHSQHPGAPLVPAAHTGSVRFAVDGGGVARYSAPANETFSDAATCHDCTRRACCFSYSNSRCSPKSPMQAYHQLRPTAWRLPIPGFRDVFVRPSRSEPS